MLNDDRVELNFFFYILYDIVRETNDIRRLLLGFKYDIRRIARGTRDGITNLRITIGFQVKKRKKKETDID